MDDCDTCNTRLKIFNYCVISIFPILVLLHINYLRYPESRSLFSLTTLLTCIISLICNLYIFKLLSLVRITLCFAMVFYFEDFSLTNAAY